MKNFLKWFGVMALAGLLPVAGAVPQARAQRRAILGWQGSIGQGINLNYLVGPGMSLNQAAYNTMVARTAANYIPPFYMYGYGPAAARLGASPLFNPYLNPYLNPYTNPYTNPVANPYLYGAGYGAGDPYSALYSAGGLPGTAGYAGGSALTSAGGLPGTAPYDTGTSNPYGGYGGYGESPTGGFFRGTADVINAQGNVKVKLEQSKLMHEQARQARIETRRKLFDEIMYERAHTPSYSEEQEKSRQRQVAYAQTLAPVTEVWSARALNTLLNDAKLLHGKKVYGPDADLDPETLKAINVRGGGNGNIGLLKSDQPLSWPVGLKDLAPAEEAKDLRETVESKMVEAARQAKEGKVHAGVVNDLRTAVNRLHRLLARNVNQVGANEYIQAKRFLNQVDDAVTALQDPNVAGYFNPFARVKTIRDLVDVMAAKGLSFAPATSGDEPAYRALYQALANYDISAHQKLGVQTAENK